MDEQPVVLTTGLLDKADTSKVQVLDVRPILRRKEEPFQVIMSTVSNLEPGEALLLLATFEPKPLFQVMKGKGFDHEARQRDDGDWEVLFIPRSVS